MLKQRDCWTTTATQARLEWQCASCCRAARRIDDSTRNSSVSSERNQRCTVKQHCHSSVHPASRRNADYTRSLRRNCMYGRHYSWSLLEDRSSDPPSQVLSPMDAHSRADSTVVKRSCSGSITCSGYKQNHQRKMLSAHVLAHRVHEKSVFIQLYCY